MPRRPHRLPAVPVYVALLFVESLGAMLTFTVTNLYYVTRLGMSPLALVLCGTAMELAIFVFEVPTGVVADLVSRRTSVVVSYLVIGVAVIGFGTLASVPLVIACYALWGFGYTFQSGALDAWLADEIGAERLTRVVLRGAQAGWAGALLGVVLSTVLAGAVGLQPVIVAGGVVTVVVGAALALVMPETGFRPHETPEDGGVRAFAATARRGARGVRGHPVLLLLVGVALAYGAWTESFDRLWVARIVEVGVPSGRSEIATVGVLTGVAFALGIVATEIAARRLRDTTTHGLARVLTALSAALVVAALGFALAGSFGASLITYVAVVALRSLVGPLQNAWVNRTIEDSSVRATTLSMVSQADALGQVAGGPVIGGLATAVSLRAGLACGALLLGPAVLLTRAARTRLAPGAGAGTAGP